jgi:hypothetical protein
VPNTDETQPQLTPPNSDPHATLDRPADAPPPGAIVIPGYDLQPEIARGGMGVVYAARDLAFGREVAIKVMLPGMDAAAFVREARITGRLPHPGIPPVYALGELPDGRPFLAMKLIRGDTLDKVLKARGTDLTADRGRLLAAFEQMCHAVGYAHAQGIIHRDLKPSNIMVGAFGEVQVMDWGLAKETRSAEVGTGNETTTDSAVPPSALPDPSYQATVAGQIKGTPAHMAPQQARGEPVDARADVFALGGILAAILTGKPPFAGNSVLDTIIRAAQAELGETFAHLDAAGADADLLALCKTCLTAKADDRYSDATELAHAVAAYRAEVEARLLQAERERAAAEERRKRRFAQRALVASVVLLLLAGGVGAAFASLWRAAETQRDAAEMAEGVAVEQKRIAEQAKTNEELARKRLAVFEYGGTMRMAHQEWRDNNLVAMRALLDGTDPQLRNWEWRYLNKLCDPTLLTLKGHTNGVTAASFSADGTRIVTGSGDDAAKVWDAKTGAEVLTLKGHTNGVTAASFSADGTRIVTGSDDKTATVWDAKSGAEVLTLKGHTRAVFAASFSADGTRIVTGSWDRTAKVWDAKSGAEVLTLKGHTDSVTAASFSADGTRIVTGSWDQTAKAWDAPPPRAK